MVKSRTKFISMVLLYGVFLVFSMTECVQGEIDEPAEIVASIDSPDNRIPPIKVTEWTTIDLDVIDAYGINWSDLSTRLTLRANYWWPIIHPNWRPFLGYSSLRFEPEIIEGDPRGWFMKVTPSGIPNADQGLTYDLKLEVKTDDIAVDYAVVVGIKVTRVDVFGEDSGISYIYIPVKASALNNVKMNIGTTTKEAAPHSYVNFDITVSNLGYYKDMFKLDFIEENKLKALTSKQLFVLNPGESQNLRINVFTPEKFFDLGTPNKIEIYATSSGDLEPIHLGTIVVFTKGIFISPLIGMIAAPIIIFLIIIYILFFYIRNKKQREMFGKPDKPWNLPEERKYLEKLKEKDKEEYNNVLKMMRDEYKSALLWYKSYHDTTSEILGSKSGFLINLFKKPKKDDKPIKQDTKIQGMENKETKKEEKLKHETLNKDIKDEFNGEKNRFKTLLDNFAIKEKTKKTEEKQKEKEEKAKKAIQLPIKKKSRKDKALLKIKRRQDKQRRKLGKKVIYKND